MSARNRCAAMAVLALSAAWLSCATGDMTTSTESDHSVLGNWHLTAQLTAYGTDWNGTETPTGTSCQQEGDLAVTEQRPDGRLSWSLDLTTVCSPPSAFDGRRSFIDTWENTAWGWIQHDQVDITTPWDLPFLPPPADSCNYRGRVRDGSPSSMLGNAVCGGSWGSVSYRGSWTAVRR